MVRRRPLTTIVMMSLSIFASAAGAARADELPSLKVRQLFEPSVAKPIFTPEVLAAVAQNVSPATTSTRTNNHQFGVGVRLGVEDPAVGASARYFFYGGPLGVQAELSIMSIDFQPDDIWAVRFSPSAIYRWYEYKFNGPVSLTPYAGAGLSFLRTKFDEDVYGPGHNDTNLGLLLYGGVELFFTQKANIGVSGELTYNSNDDIENEFGETSAGGVTFTAAGHWYFW